MWSDNAGATPNRQDKTPSGSPKNTLGLADENPATCDAGTDGIYGSGVTGDSHELALPGLFAARAVCAPIGRRSGCRELMAR
jgi:hypothetical protein